MDSPSTNQGRDVLISQKLTGKDLKCLVKRPENWWKLETDYGECVDNGGFKQLAWPRVDWTLGLGDATHLLSTQ